ncbi:MAG: alpha/beta hydrolase [Candidatus Paceibacterota bacterium]
MKKVFIIHGFNSCPNSSWIPWLMGELKLKDVYACSLAMPNPEAPICSEWVNEISRHVGLNKNDEIYFVGHSLGVAAILNYLQNSDKSFPGAVLVAGRFEKSNNPLTENFYKDFDFEIIKSNLKDVSIIHGDNDTLVVVENAYKLGDKLDKEPIIIPNGVHLNGSAGWKKLPEVLEELEKMFVKNI